MNLASELRAIVRGDVDTREETLRFHSRDASIFHVRPQVVVFPKDAADVAAVVKFANEHRDEKVSITARSGGTDMSGGALGESIILNFGRYMHKLGPIDHTHHLATAEPGVYYRDFEKETLRHNLLMPSYPASREICMIGGIVSNNSGGEKSLTYGKTERYVSEIKTVLSDGNEYRIRPLSVRELQQKMKQKDFEGSVYTKLFSLLDSNYELIQKARPAVSKNSAGYALWNVWNRETFDLTKLFVGSQGTLGIVTSATLKLVRPAPHSRLLVIFLKDLAPLADIVKRILGFTPESFESYDDYTLKFAMRYAFELAKLMKAKNFFRLIIQFIPEMLSVFRGGLPKLVLLAEFTGENEEEVLARAQEAERSLTDLHLRTRVTRDAEDARKYWTIRRESFNLLRHHVRGLHTAPFIDDMVVAPEHLPEFLPRLEAILREYSFVFTIAGHIGNGNFHIIPLMDFRDPETESIIFELSEQVYSLVMQYKGSITGEHNDGIVRTPFLKKMYGEKICALFEEVKNIFDPHDIFNPGKKVRGTLDYARAHIIRD